MSLLIDICIVVYPIYLVSDLQMVSATKAKVVVGFASRIPYVLQPSLVQS